MDVTTQQQILDATGATEVVGTQLIQKLWNNYGELLRVQLRGGEVSSVILKHIRLPEDHYHPKGFNTALSKQRKIHSYHVEAHWYHDYNPINLQDGASPTARCLASFEQADQSFILLEDLDAIGYSRRIVDADFAVVKVVLCWLASFHAKFMGRAAEGLWPVGSYWHLETRPDELQQMEASPLKDAAFLIDEKLKNSPYQTLIHGDAKLANFCFSDDAQRVAAVDFQYVGGGCGMKDVAYFIGSCFGEAACEAREGEILDYYFKQLARHLKGSPIDCADLEAQWRALYPVAWADFHRFLKGWSPDHWKINSYSERTSRDVVDEIHHELLSIAQSAAVEAGKLIKSYWQQSFEVGHKAGSTAASSVVTEVDLLSQKLIIERLAPSMVTYGLGLLAEEEGDDGSRLERPYFWSVDPLDGTLYFSEGKPGFAVSIALIDQQGDPLLGVVYDPVSGDLYHALRGGGCFCNNQRLQQERGAEGGELQLFADRSLAQAPDYDALAKAFDIQMIGGAVINSLQVLLNPNACYFKYPKAATGGCAIWDLAAVALMLEEAGGMMSGFAGELLSFNDPESIYFNRSGLMVCSAPAMLQAVRARLQSAASAKIAP
uniref:CHK kinase-like domain-containing protein n=1 Tax=Magnetococcus massalia (strain MO-1) TaxID=451514 RepID=A0A1S7LJ33_MAGMO|nr:Conserved protein of unknown function [Candidatus Magnetococcus massalia]